MDVLSVILATDHSYVRWGVFAQPRKLDYVYLELRIPELRNRYLVINALYPDLRPDILWLLGRSAEGRRATYRSHSHRNALVIQRRALSALLALSRQENIALHFME